MRLEVDAAPDLGALFEEVWQRLRRGVADRRAAARHPVLATTGTAGGAEARVVVLRAADRAAGRLQVHTDAASAKVAELAAEPRASLLVWDARARLQVRLRVRVAVRPGSAVEWARVPEGARRAYGGHPAPGTQLAGPEGHDPAPDPARFTVLEAEIAEIEVLRLADERHLRARFRRAEGWRGAWLAP